MSGRFWATILGVGATVAVTMMLASCNDGTDIALPASTSNSTTTTPPATSTGPLFDRSDDRPVLTIGQFDWAHPVIWTPRDLHSIAVYPDGVIVRTVSVEGPGLAMLTATIPSSDVESMVALADDAGLALPGVLAAEPAPQPVADGGYAVFTRRLQNGIARVAVDQPGIEGEDVSTARRSVLYRLLTLVLDRDDAAWTEMSIGRWAVESAGPLPTLETIEWPWVDLDPDGLTWEFNGAGVRCAIVDDADWPYSLEEAQDYPTLTNGVFRRPLLPHEDTCADVFDWRAELGYESQITMTPEDVSPTT